jgi:ABC-type phosphate transport system substrate-binding protein
MLLFVLLVTMSADVRAFHVIVNRANPVNTLTRDEVSSIFMKRTRQWKTGADILPVDQRSTSDQRESFSRTIHDKSVQYVIRYWQRVIFSGRGIPPRELQSDEDVLDLVSTHEGAIGYVSAGVPLPDTVKVIEVAP